MNVLHISYYDNRGGSGRSAYKIHSGLRDLGIQSRMLVRGKTTSDTDVETFGIQNRREKLETKIGHGLDRLGLQYFFQPSSLRLNRHPWFLDADVIQLYNTHGGYFSHLALPRMSRLRPVVWRLSDMWPFTGQCSYSYDCDAWLNGCGRCSPERLQDFPALSWDSSALLWRVKRLVYSRSNICVVAPSRWMEKLARQSPLFEKFPIFYIPNGLDIETFSPKDRPSARKKLNVPLDLPLILFSADSLADPRKGGAYLKEALSILAHRKVSFRVLTMGKGQIDDLMYPVHALGNLDDDSKIALAYAASDLFVLPTLAENLPNGVLESMACGTPSVAFDVGGVPDAVRHLDTGFLAKYRSAEDLADGIQMLLQDDTLRERVAQKARSVVEDEFTDARQAEAFYDLYKNIQSKGIMTLSN